MNTTKRGIEIPVNINRTYQLMELDTVAGASITSEEMYNKHFTHIAQQPCSTYLYSYTGHSFKVSGQITENV